MATSNCYPLSLRVPIDTQQLLLFSFHKGEHYCLVGVLGSTIYWMDSLSMGSVPKDEACDAVLHVVECVTGVKPEAPIFINGYDSWHTLTGVTGVEPETQHDTFQCGVFVCMYLWEILHKQKWGGDVASFRLHVRETVGAPSKASL